MFSAFSLISASSILLLADLDNVLFQLNARGTTAPIHLRRSAKLDL